MAGLSQRIEGSGARNSHSLQLAEPRRGKPTQIEDALQRRIEGLVCAQQRELIGFYLRLLNPHIAVVFERQENGVAQTETQLAVVYVVLQVLWWRQLAREHLLREQPAIVLAILCIRQYGQHQKQPGKPQTIKFHLHLQSLVGQQSSAKRARRLHSLCIPAVIHS